MVRFQLKLISVGCRFPQMQLWIFILFTINALTDWPFDHATVISAVVTGIATCFIAWFTITLSKFSGGQFSELSKQVRLAREEFLSTHRPEIRLKHIWLSEPLSPNRSVMIDFNFVNIGNTDATLERYNFSILILPPPVTLPQRPPYYGNNASNFSINPSVLPSGITLSVPNQTDNKPLSISDYSMVLHHQRELWCVGNVQYSDQLGRMRTTAFARRLDSTDWRFRNPNKPDSDYEYQD